MFLYYNKTYIIIIKVNHSIHAFKQWCSNRTLKIKCIDKISNKVILQQKKTRSSADADKSVQHNVKTYIWVSQH